MINIYKLIKEVADANMKFFRAIVITCQIFNKAI